MGHFTLFLNYEISSYHFYVSLINKLSEQCALSAMAGKGVGSYWITRVIFLRLLGLIYFVAFLVAWNQNGVLIGEKGLTPSTSYLKDKSSLNFMSKIRSLNSMPSIFLFMSPSEYNLRVISGFGLLLSSTLVVSGISNMIILFTLWVLYTSLVNIGQTWYSFGWESQLLETGFLAIFLVPFFSLHKYPYYLPTPWVCIWGYRWLIFRIMLGAGLIKIRGDECWRDLTCMNYHYQTQPVPNPISPLLHFAQGIVIIFQY